MNVSKKLKLFLVFLVFLVFIYYKKELKFSVTNANKGNEQKLCELRKQKTFSSLQNFNAA